MLNCSLDGLNWFPAGCIAQTGKLSQSLMYARPVIDDDKEGFLTMEVPRFAERE